MASIKIFDFSDKANIDFDYSDECPFRPAKDMSLSIDDLTLGTTPYTIADIVRTYNFKSSEEDRVLKGALDCPIELKDKEIKPDSDIIAILRRSETLRSETLTGQLPPLSHSGKRPHPLTSLYTLVNGNVKYVEGGHTIDCSIGCCMLIPKTAGKMETDALFILLVPDSEVVTELAFYKFPQRFQCIVVSAEGPHDLLTRMESELNLPVLGLFCPDPHSLKMLAFYATCLKNFKWLGIRPTDIMAKHSGRLSFSMTTKDVNTVKDVLKDAVFKTRLEWRQELQNLVKNKRMIGIEALALCGLRSYLTGVFLPMKLQLEDWI